jgi:hypothetical protein
MLLAPERQGRAIGSKSPSDKLRPRGGVFYIRFWPLADIQISPFQRL